MLWDLSNVKAKPSRFDRARLSTLRNVAAFTAALLIAGCGGGGGSAGSVQPPAGSGGGALVYSGSVNATSFNSTNAKEVLNNVLGDNQSLGAVNSANNGAATSTAGSTVSAQSAIKTGRVSIQSATRLGTLSSRTVDTNYNCAIGDTHVKGTIQSDGSGNFVLQFMGCQSNGLNLTGSMTVTLFAADPAVPELSKVALSMSNVSAVGGPINVTMAGDVAIVDNASDQTEATTYNITTLDNVNGRQMRLVNVKELDAPVANNSTGGFSSQLSGRIYDSIDGYVDISSVSPLVFADSSAQFPSSGGPVILLGAANTQLRITPSGNTSVYLEGDFNGDRTYEAIAHADWRTLNDPNPGANVPPLANAGADHSIVVGLSENFTGSASTDVDGDFITFNWQLQARPSGSNTQIVGPDTMTPAFVPDVEGDYALALRVTDEHGASQTATVHVKAITRHALGFDVIDAGYSKTLQKAVLAASRPTPAVHLYDPVTGNDVSIALGWAPTSVALSPDGLFAAVGHKGAVSYIDLTQRIVVRTFSVNTDIFSLVWASNGYIYAFPDGTQWDPAAWGTLRIFNTAAGGGGEIPSLSIISGESRGAVQPSTGVLYVTPTTNIDPLMINWYDISTGAVSAEFRSLTSVRQSACGGFWFSDDGARMYSRCGRVFTPPPPPPYVTSDADLTFLGIMEGGNTGSRIISLSDSIPAGRVVSIDTGDRVNDPLVNDDDSVTFYDRNQLLKIGNVRFPAVAAQGGRYSVHGKFVFFEGSGKAVVVIGQADSQASLANDYFLMHF